MKIYTILLTALIGLAWADKDSSSSGLRQSAVFSAHNNPYQLDQQSGSEQGQTHTRVTHSATQTPQNSFAFGQDVQGKQFGQTGSNSFEFGASGNAPASFAYPQKPGYPDSSSGGYPSTSYNPAPSYAPPAVGGYPASVGGYLPPSQVSITQQKPQFGPPTGEQYAYQYTHYPQQTQHADYGTETHGGVSSFFDGDLFSSFGSGEGFGLEGLSGLGGGAGGPGIAAAAGIKALKALKGISIVAKIAKHFLLVKPFIILGLLLLVALPFIILFLPIPVITLAPPPGRSDGSDSRASNEQILTAYITELTSKVFNAEECLERIICKMPEMPEKYRGKAKGIWEEVGSKYLTSGRVARGLNAYFEDNSGDLSAKNRTFKCDQKFKCTNKFFK